MSTPRLPKRPFGRALPSAHIVFRPRGSIPTSTVCSTDQPSGVLHPAPIMRFIGFQCPGQPASRLPSGPSSPMPCPPERFPSTKLPVATPRWAEAMPPRRCATGLRRVDLEALSRVEIRCVPAGVPDGSTRGSPGLPIPGADPAIPTPEGVPEGFRQTQAVSGHRTPPEGVARFPPSSWAEEHGPWPKPPSTGSRRHRAIQTAGLRVGAMNSHPHVRATAPHPSGGVYRV